MARSRGGVAVSSAQDSFRVSYGGEGRELDVTDL